MKALISPNEIINRQWVSSWNQNEDDSWTPVYSTVVDVLRVAQVEPDDKIFEVADPLFWTDCPTDCVADYWYYKEGTCYIFPVDMRRPDLPPPSENGAVFG